MTSDEKDNPSAASGGDDAPDSPKRPSRTIELEAEEVEIEVKPDPDGPVGDEDGIEAGDEHVSSTASPEKSATGPKLPLQRTKPSEVKGFVTHLAAGLIGGLVGVVGAGVGLEKLPLSGLLGKSDAPEQIIGIEQRLNALEEKSAGQSKSLEGVARSEKLDTLEKRLTGLESKPSVAPPVPQAITDRLGKLEDTLKTLGSAAGEAGASGLELSTALTAKIDDVSSDFEKRTGAAREEMTELKKALQALETRQSSGNEDNEKALTARLDTLEGKVSTLAARPAMPSGQASVVHGAGSEGAALALAFESLRRAVESGEPYTSRLEALAKLAPEGLDLSELSKTASPGVETERSLLRTLPQYLRDARVTAAKPDDDTFFDRLVSNARSVVRVRRIGPAEGKTAVAVLARMEVHMKSSGLAAVLQEASGLSGPALKSLQPWLDRAKAHRASRAGLNALEKSLLASLEPGVKAQR